MSEEKKDLIEKMERGRGKMIGLRHELSKNSKNLYPRWCVMFVAKRIISEGKINVRLG